MDPESSDRGRGAGRPDRRKASDKGADKARSTRRERRRARQPDSEPWNLRFESIGIRIPAAMVAKSPTLLKAAVEEVCWRVARDAWLAARPRRWRLRAYAAWSAQRAELDRIREQLRRLVEAELLTC